MSEPVFDWLTIAQRMDHWFETMRTERGYGGPVVHWWRNCLQYTGAGLDWRYEGIISAYLTLHERTGDAHYLEQACCAGDDLVFGQLASGNFRHSAFELNPYTGGTPHEAAADIGLLKLALALRELDDPRAEHYAEAAQRNLHAFWIERLWNEEQGYFRDHHRTETFVPNKSSTLSEAFFLLATWTGDDSLIERHVLPTLKNVIGLQVQPEDRRESLHGGIAQNIYGTALKQHYFPYYVGRCIPALLQAYEHTNAAFYKEAALAAGAFMLRWRNDDGSFPQLIYGNEAVNPYQQWVAAVGDMLLALDKLVPYGFEYDPLPSQLWLLQGVHNNGGIDTGRGFAAKTRQQLNSRYLDYRDILPVCGWADKAFRYVTLQIPETVSLADAEPPTLRPVMRPCMVQGRMGHYYEDAHEIVVRRDKDIWYRWQKGQAWADICHPRLALK